MEVVAPWGRVVELACGTGEWTVELVEHASQLTAVDRPRRCSRSIANASPVPTSATSKADLFAWTPPDRYDVVFFSTWLPHVPPQRLEDFWALVAACLDHEGRVCLIDDGPAVAAHEHLIVVALLQTPPSSLDGHPVLECCIEPSCRQRRAPEVGAGAIVERAAPALAGLELGAGCGRDGRLAA